MSSVFNHPGDAPPAYSDEMSSDAAQGLLDRIRTTVQTEQGSADEPETQRLKNFLLYCLVGDYRMSMGVTFNASDHQHYVEMRALTSNLEHAHHHANLNGEERESLAPYFWKHLHIPCRNLSIPVEYAIVMMLRFVKYTNAWGRYKGCAYGILHTHGPSHLAKKLWQDRSVLIPSLMPPGEARDAFLTRLNDFAQQYFTSIEGINSVTLEHDRLGFNEFLDISFTLTDRGKSYEHAQGYTWDIIKASAIVGCDLLEDAKSILLGLKTRREVFPKGKKDADQEAYWSGPDSTQGMGQRNYPNGWVFWPAMHLPDFWENLPAFLSCDS